jgi:hypothetical protein
MSEIQTNAFLYDYENYPLSKSVYSDINAFLEQHPNLKDREKVIIYVLNHGNGLGSELTIFIHMAYYLNSINNKLHVLPMFCNNTDNFKYHSPEYNNTFFKYFKYNQLQMNIPADYSVYFIKSAIIPSAIPFFNYEKLPPILYSPAMEYIHYFRSKFTLCIGDHIKTYVNSIKESGIPLIGIHIRSLYQKKFHQSDYLSIGIQERLAQIKIELDMKYNNAYSIFIATDVNIYLTYANTIFTKIHYLENINRIDNEYDSIPQLDEYTGFKLGSDILYDCLALSLCDVTYISKSNIPFIISIINPNCSMIEY